MRRIDGQAARLGMVAAISRCAEILKVEQNDFDYVWYVKSKSNNTERRHFLPFSL